MQRTLLPMPGDLSLSANVSISLGLVLMVLVSSTAGAQTTNLALNGTATQSSDYSATAGMASNGIDGNTSGVWGQGSVTHTLDQLNSWWQVDLGSVFSLETLRIYNRSDCCGTRLSNFWIIVQNGSAEVFRQDYYMGSGSVAGGGMLEIQLPPGTSGNVAAIGFHGLNNDGNGFLSLAEFEVMGGAVGTPYCVMNPNSVGLGAHLLAGGSESLTSNDLVLYSAPVPDQPGIFFYGANQVQVPFGDGYLCVAGQLNLLYPPAVSALNQAVRVIDYTAMPAGGQVTVGSTWNFQHWYRDPAFGGAAFNTSDAISITFTP